MFQARALVSIAHLRGRKVLLTGMMPWPQQCQPLILPADDWNRVDKRLRVYISIMSFGIG